MNTTDIIRKYNQRLFNLKKQKSDNEDRYPSNSKDRALLIIEIEIDETEKFIKDLVYIQTQMPAINPIDRGNYNEAPEGLKEISLQEWQRGMFLYCLFQSDSKQVRGEQTFDLRLFDVPNFDRKKLGFAVMNDWFDKERGKNREERIIRFCRYGLDEDWTSFENKFAAQFAGDNS